MQAPHDILYAIQRAMGLHQAGKLEAAAAAYKHVLADAPDQFEALHFLGLIQAQRGRLADADRLISRSLKTNPQRAEPYSNYARVLRELNRPNEALRTCERALSFNPNFVDALIIRGNALRDLGRFADALASLDKALALAPGHFVALAARGDILVNLKRYDEAAACYDRAIAIKPDYANVVNSRGSLLHELGTYEDAVACYDRALALQPDFADAFNNRGLALHELQRWHEAIGSFDKAIELRPDHADAHFNRAATLLLTGNFAEGWREYEYRFDTREPTTARPTLSLPSWNGEALIGRRIVVYAEQGFGDIIQFARYLPLLKRAGAEVTFLAPAKLARLFAPLRRDVTLVSSVDESRASDFQCALASLARRFGTDESTVPCPVPYLFAEDDRVKAWRARIGTHGFKIGICWQGTPNRYVDKGRSVPLNQMLPLSQIPGVRLISLQKQHGLDQLLRMPPEMRVETPDAFDAGADAFIDTAAIMNVLDLVVTSDTSVAHLAGALGRPTWLALKYVPEWRWMLQRDDTPWYPSIRLFRQPARGDWPAVFSAMAEALCSLVSPTSPEGYTP
jgi:tetratricopeptide (TPR) repeat protein